MYHSGNPSQYTLKEQGLLHTPRNSFNFSSQYHFILKSEQSQLQILHHDQTPFLLLPYTFPLENCWQVEHHCGQDHYKGIIERLTVLESENPFHHLKVTWVVEGPRKHYEMTSEYGIFQHSH